MPTTNDRGQVAPLGALLVLATVGALWLVGLLGNRAIEFAQARTAADASALAGALSDESVAREIASRNGAVVRDFRDGDPLVDVDVEFGGATASARAERIRTVVNGLHPDLVAAIASVEAELGQSIPIVSGFRSPEQQQVLWDNRFTNPYPVAPPGTSNHERGFAIDVPSWFAATLARVGPSHGVCQPLPVSDPIHFELCQIPNG